MSKNTDNVYHQVGVAMTCRSYQEYKDMFVLGDLLKKKRVILDVAGGASSFICEVNNLGHEAVAADPLYELSCDRIKFKAEEHMADAAEKLGRLRHNYDWKYYGSIENHLDMRRQSLELFLSHYRNFANINRYIASSLPELPFAENTFDLILCSHFLFLYEDQFDFEFHVSSIQELVRICRPNGEVRIYPLVNLRLERYSQLDRLMDCIRDQNIFVELIPTEFTFIPGASEVLRIVNSVKDKD